MNMSILASRARRLDGRIRARRWAVLHRNISVGEGAWVGRGCRLRLDPEAQLVLGPRCGVDDGATLAVYGQGRLELGTGSFVGHHATLAARELVVIGDGAFLAEMVSVRDHDHAVGRPPSSGEVTIGSVSVGKNAWLGSKVTVLRGAEIGDGAVVGAHAVVRGVLPPGVVAVGIPARVVEVAAEEHP